VKTIARTFAFAIALVSFSAFADSLRSDLHFVKIEPQPPAGKSRQFNVQVFDAESRQNVAHLKVTTTGDTPAEAETTAGGTRYSVRIMPYGTSYLVAFDADAGEAGVDSMRGGFQEQTAADTAPSHPAQAGRDVAEAKVVRRVEPVYTEAARAAGATGTVILEVLIGKSGFVRDAKVVKPMGYGLDEAAADAVKQWQFEPSMQGRVPVEVLQEVTLELKP
jgi:TonB family protein